jgi:para-aminobenzoate synthetase component 1
MQIIDELEPTERSVYTGCIGYFAPGGRMTMNIAIRTMIQAGGKLHWYAGGGMVADSDPVAEYDETCAKALGMRKALGIGNSSRLSAISFQPE